MTYGVGFRLPNHPRPESDPVMNDEALKAILIAAVGSALGALAYQFFILPMAQKYFNNG